LSFGLRNEKELPNEVDPVSSPILDEKSNERPWNEKEFDESAAVASFVMLLFEDAKEVSCPSL